MTGDLAVVHPDGQSGHSEHKSGNTDIHRQRRDSGSWKRHHHQVLGTSFDLIGH